MSGHEFVITRLLTRRLDFICSCGKYSGSVDRRFPGWDMEAGARRNHGLHVARMEEIEAQRRA